MLEALSNDWHVFHGIRLGDRGDLDHVVIGPGGVFCLQTKHVRGRFSKSSDGQLLYNDLPTSWGKNALFQAMTLRDRLVLLVGPSNVWITAMLVVPFAWVDLTGPIRNVHLVHQDNLIETLETWPKRLDRKDVERYVGVVQSRTVHPRTLRARLT